MGSCANPALWPWWDGLHHKDQRHRQFFARASRLTLHWIYWALLLHICRKSFLVLGDFNLLMANIEHCLYLRWRSYLAVSRYSVSRSAVTLYPSRTFPVSFGIIVNVVILWILLRRLHFVFIITIINNNNVMNHHLPWGGGYEPCTGAVGCLGRTKGWTNGRTSPQNPESCKLAFRKFCLTIWISQTVLTNTLVADCLGKSVAIS